MKALWMLVKKNLKVLIRTKSSALIVFLAPLLLILILGVSYNSSEVSLNVGVYANTLTGDVTAFVDLLDDNFTVVTYEANVEECVEDMKDDFIHTCVALPDSFSFAENGQKEVMFYTDPSNINLVAVVQQAVGEKFKLKSQEVSKALTQDLLNRLSSTKEKIGTRKGELGALREKTAGISSSTSSVKGQLATVDVSITSAAVDTTVVGTVSSGITSAISKVEAAKSALNDVNLSSSDRATIKSLLEEADSGLGTTLNSVNGTENSVETALVNYQKSLEETNSKLTAAATTISSTNENLANVETTLAESVSAIDGLAGGLSEIETSIAEQKVTDAETIAAPFSTKVATVTEEGTFLNYAFPALLVLIVMFSALLLGTTLVMMDKHSPAFFRNFFLPVRRSTFVLSTYVTSIILLFVQIAVILGVSLFFLEGIGKFIPVIGLTLFMGASVFTFLGMTMGYLFRSETTGVIASISTGSLLMFVSGVVLPLENIAPRVREFVSFNPFVITERVIRSLFFFQASLEKVWIDLAILAGYALVLFLAILILATLARRSLMGSHKKHRKKQKKKKHKQ